MIGIGLQITTQVATDIGPVAPPPSFIGLLEAEGQSNIVGFNSVDALPLSARRLYSGVSQLSITAGAGTAAPTVQTLDYLLAADGETVAGQPGRYGERCLCGGGGSGGVGPTFGLVTAYDTGTLWGSASGVLLSKTATAGQHIDAFLPSLSGAVWQNKVHGRRHLRQSLAGLNAPLRTQAKIWWQGEANTNAPRDAADVNHPDITTYAQDFEEVYAFDEAQMGPLPPWFVVALAPTETALGSGLPDPYTEALNAELRSLCRWQVSLTGTITDLANGGHSERYFVDHGLRNGNATHLTASQMQQIGQAITTALLSINGADGASQAYTPALRPVITSLQEEDISGSDLTLSIQTTDGGILNLAAQPAGSPPPDSAALSGGSSPSFITSLTSTIPLPHAPGGTVSATLSGLPLNTPLDIYAQLATDGIESPIATLPAVSLPDTASGWDVTYQPSMFTYSDNGALVSNMETGTRYARGTQTHDTGKRVFEIDLFGSVVFVGLGDQNAPLGGGTNGLRKAGWLGTTLRFSGGGLIQMGAHINSQATVQIAADLSARLLWLRAAGASDWNNTSGADPASGTGGVDIAGVLGPLLPLSGLGPGTDTSARLRTTALTLPIPSGFLAWG